MGNNENKDFEIKFWKDWLYADFLERQKLVENLPIVKEGINIDKTPIKIRKHFFATLLNSFFEDLESAVYTKIDLDKKKKSKKR